MVLRWYDPVYTTHIYIYTRYIDHDIYIYTGILSVLVSSTNTMPHLNSEFNRAGRNNNQQGMYTNTEYMIIRLYERDSSMATQAYGMWPTMRHNEAPPKNTQAYGSTALNFLTHTRYIDIYTRALLLMMLLQRICWLWVFTRDYLRTWYICMYVCKWHNSSIRRLYISTSFIILARYVHSNTRRAILRRHHIYQVCNIHAR